MEQVATRLPHFLAYHYESQRCGDIDPSYHMLRYVCDRFELNLEQRYWLAFVYAMTYCGASTFYVYNEFPDFENVHVPRMERWWVARGRTEIICQTDRRWVRSSSLFVPAVQSYQAWLKGKPQHEHFMSIAKGATPEERYDRLYASASQLYSFGQFALFLYLEALHTITPLDLAPTNLDLDKAWSCRNGLYYAYGLDHHIEDTESPIKPEAILDTRAAWDDLLVQLRGAPQIQHTTVWQLETTLCAYRKFHRGKRYIGYYIDRQCLEIAKMAEHVKNGVCWDVLWDYRASVYSPIYLAESLTPAPVLAKKGLPGKWKETQVARTLAITNEEHV